MLEICVSSFYHDKKVFKKSRKTLKLLKKKAVRILTENHVATELLNKKHSSVLGYRQFHKKTL
mgnify:CR=1 FL=1